MGDTAARAESTGEINPLHVGEITFFGRNGGGSGVTVYRPAALDSDSHDLIPTNPFPDIIVADA